MGCIFQSALSKIAFWVYCFIIRRVWPERKLLRRFVAESFSRQNTSHDIPEAASDCFGQTGKRKRFFQRTSE
jgi:hypothetical protein